MATKVKSSDADIEMLIAEVQIRPTLWNDCEKNFKNTIITRKLWCEVGSRINISGEAAKSKWKNLKDKFRKLLAKIPYIPSGSEALIPNKDTPKWKFFQSMMFIKDIISPAKTFGNLSTNQEQETTESRESDGEISSDDNDILSLSETERTNATISMSTTSSREKMARVGTKRKQLKTDDKDERLFKLEEKKIAAIVAMQEGKQEKGPDYHFLMGLLPYIEELDKPEKLELQSKMHALVSDAYNKHRASRNSNTVVQQHQANSRVPSSHLHSRNLSQYDVGDDLSTISFFPHETHIDQDLNGNYMQLTK